MNKFIYKADGNVPYFISENIKTKHGFSTRLGGVSTEPWVRSLNFGKNRGDTDENIKRNEEIFCRATGCDASTLTTAEQIHSDIVLNIDGFSKTGAGIYRCDGFVTNKKGITLGVKVADCVPILLCDNENGVIGALHAGWRGACSGIARQGVLEMIKAGADIEKINAAIGASIHNCCYEVGEDFIDELCKILGEKHKKYITIKGGKYYADIQSISVDFLLECGVLPENISVNPLCTCCNPTLFFSHRASHGKRGTMLAVISL